MASSVRLVRTGVRWMWPAMRSWAIRMSSNTA